MEFLQTFLNHFLIGFAAAAVLAPFIIHVLYKGGVVIKHMLMKNRMNEEFYNLHKKKSGTPTMGGLIIVIPFIILMLVLVPMSPIRNAFLISFILFSLYGFADEMIVKTNLGNKDFRLFQESFMWRLGKLGILYAIGLASTILIQNALDLDSVTIAGLFSIPFTGIWTVFWAAFVISGTYGAEITDGLDGLVTGLFIIAYLAYLGIIMLTGTVVALPIIGLLMGAMIVYLYFNITPARVFMGGVGAIPLGFGLMFLAVLTNTLVPFLIITFVFWVELLSSVLQIISIRFFGRKIFKIAPLHHHFESIGWSESKVVQRFWLVGGVLALFGLWIYVSFLG